MSKKKTNKKDKKRVDMDVRPYPSPFFKNYDYGGSDEGDETSPGMGLYHGPMDRYESVMEFRKIKEKAREKRKKAWLEILELIK